MFRHARNDALNWQAADAAKPPAPWPNTPAADAFIRARTNMPSMTHSRISFRSNSICAAADCVPVHGNGTAMRVGWKNDAALAALAGRPVRLRFHVGAGQLFAFWVSKTEAGASNGFVAAGGPGFTGNRDV